MTKPELQHLKEHVSGVYKITCKETGEFYIGCSSNIRKRWYAHRTRSQCPGKEYNKKLYQAMRKYGRDNFTYEVLEECSPEIMHSREIYYINKLDANNKGYNNIADKDRHGRARLSLDDVIDIRERYNEHESKRNVFLDYKDKISEKGFHKIWNGYNWKTVMMDVYTAENKLFHKNNTGSAAETNHKTKLSNEDVLLIRNMRQNGVKVQDAYKEYQDKITFKSFQNIWYGCNWKSIA